MVDIMCTGNPPRKTIDLRVTEGTDVKMIGEQLVQLGVLESPEEFYELCKTGEAFMDFTFIAAIEDDPSEARKYKLEGYLFPDTYEFYVGHNAEDALDRLIRNFVSRMDEDRMTQVEESSYSLQEIITIASLIEEETDGTDQANIASVIYNRLEGSGNKQGTYGLLQIDASLLYALPDHTGPITSADMQTDSPYNLYLSLIHI